MRRAFLTLANTVIPEASERFVCRVLGWCRATHRYHAKPRARDERLKPLLPILALERPWEGYRRIHDFVSTQVEPICRSSLQRLWQLLKLQVAPRKRKRRRPKTPLTLPGLRATHPHHVWCLDFLKDYTSDGRGLRFLSVVDEHTRRCLALVAARRFTAADVVAVVERLRVWHGTPVHLRSDNGPEFVATVVETHAARVGIRLVRSAPRSPWENPFAESFHSRVREEFLERETFGSVEEAQVLADAYRYWYNEERPHSALRYLTPAAFAGRLLSMVKKSA